MILKYHKINTTVQRFLNVENTMAKRILNIVKTSTKIFLNDFSLK